MTDSASGRRRTPFKRTPASGAPLPPGERRRPASIVPTDTLAGQALVMVIAIMTFLAGLTIGAVDLVRGAADAWESDVAREVTIQVRPVDGQDIEVQVGRVTTIARQTPGVSDVRALTREDTARLLEPWLGSDAGLDALPTPRLVIVAINGEPPVDLQALRSQLAREVPNASLDDHRAWVDRLSSMANLLVFGGVTILILVTAATVLSVIFATRGAMAGNRDIVNVLHIVGARDGYIARAFERRFLALAGRGGAIGGGAAILVFAIGALIGGESSGTIAAEQMTALFGRFSVGWTGYFGVVAIVAFTAAVTALTSRLTIMAQLRGRA
ncbi:cell division protein FtsX [Agaricicola taiwanensis]|uniref:Cell division protein FtsX n=1 Tax=Agaricicola taiwanensis TaxID=591372 RepID=A0A8J3DX81_9RHOB|nr:ABC transporter permease [Agaricicola taiwanensis]GGE51113.1 cell division protein FtsX [Agaricicola taiwanensis]